MASAEESPKEKHKRLLQKVCPHCGRRFINKTTGTELERRGKPLSTKRNNKKLRKRKEVQYIYFPGIQGETPTFSSRGGVKLCCWDTVLGGPNWPRLTYGHYSAEDWEDIVSDIEAKRHNFTPHSDQDCFICKQFDDDNAPPPTTGAGPDPGPPPDPPLPPPSPEEVGLHVSQMSQSSGNDSAANESSAPGSNVTDDSLSKQFTGITFGDSSKAPSFSSPGPPLRTSPSFDPRLSKQSTLLHTPRQDHHPSPSKRRKLDSPIPGPSYVTPIHRPRVPSPSLPRRGEPEKSQHPILHRRTLIWGLNQGDSGGSSEEEITVRLSSDGELPPLPASDDDLESVAEDDRAPVAEDDPHPVAEDDPPAVRRQQTRLTPRVLTTPRTPAVVHRHRKKYRVLKITRRDGKSLTMKTSILCLRSEEVFTSH